MRRWGERAREESWVHVGGNMWWLSVLRVVSVSSSVVSTRLLDQSDGGGKCRTVCRSNVLLWCFRGEPFKNVTSVDGLVSVRLVCLSLPSVCGGFSGVSLLLVSTVGGCRCKLWPALVSQNGWERTKGPSVAQCPKLPAPYECAKSSRLRWGVSGKSVLLRRVVCSLYGDFWPSVCLWLCPQWSSGYSTWWLLSGDVVSVCLPLLLSANSCLCFFWPCWDQRFIIRKRSELRNVRLNTDAGPLLSPDNPQTTDRKRFLFHIKSISESCSLLSTLNVTVERTRISLCGEDNFQVTPFSKTVQTQSCYGDSKVHTGLPPQEKNPEMCRCGEEGRSRKCWHTDKFVWLHDWNM